MTRVIIADDHRMIVDGLRLMLNDAPDIEIAGEAYSGTEVKELVNRLEQVDLVIMDINMPESNGIEATTYLKEHYPHIKVLVLTMYNKPEFIRNLLHAGASGYILKNTGKEELLQAIRSIASGGTYFSPEVSTAVMESLVQRPRQTTFQLTQREKEVLRLIVEEYTTTEIADKLFISTHTVETHRKNLLSKLNVRNTAGLVKYALETGIHLVGNF